MLAGCVTYYSSSTHQFFGVQINEKLNPYFMFRPFLLTSKFIFDSGPKIGFWIGILYFLRTWYLQQHVLIQALFVIVPVVAIIIILVKSFRELINQYLLVRAESSLREERLPNTTERTKFITKNIPKESALVAIHKYAENFASTWASDGKLDEINYYLKLNERRVKKYAQITIQSQLRREILTTYLPKAIHNIEEFDKYNYLNDKNLREIYSFPHWKEAIEKSTENSSSDIEKSDRIKLQISPSISSLHINFLFEKGNRSWRKRYILEKNKLVDENNSQIFKFK